MCQIDTHGRIGGRFGSGDITPSVSRRVSQIAICVVPNRAARGTVHTLPLHKVMSDTSDHGAASDADDKGGVVPEHLVGYFGNAKTPGGDTTPRKLKRGNGNGVCYIKQVGVEERLPWHETDVQALDDTGVKYANIVSFMDVSATDRCRLAPPCMHAHAQRRF